jgi:hypothetical protein
LRERERERERERKKEREKIEDTNDQEEFVKRQVYEILSISRKGSNGSFE